MTVDHEGGLDLSQLDSWSEGEAESFQAWYEASKGATLPGHDFWIANDPGTLKRYRLFAIEMNAETSRDYMKVAILSWLHLYAVIGYEEGISYQIRNARARGGASKDAVLATLEIAFLHSGPLGSAAVARAASDLLNGYEDARPAPWPTGWQLKPLLGLPRLDATTTTITASELTAIRDWYQSVCGQIPKYVEFLAVHRPAVLKAYLLRFAHADRGRLPGEMIPILQLQLYTVRSCGPGIREAAAMARGLGVAKQFALDAVTRAMIYAGPAAVSVVADSAGDIFAAWGDEDAPKDRSRP